MRSISMGMRLRSPAMVVMRSVLNDEGVLVYESHGTFRGDFVEVHSTLA